MYFIPCHRTDDASCVAKIFISEVVHFHGLLMTIFDRDVNFASYFFGKLYGSYLEQN